MKAKPKKAKKPRASGKKSGGRGRSGVWKGALSFGLLNIPVSLQSAEQEKELHFTQLDQDHLAPVKMKRVSSATGKEIPYNKIVKGYETEPGKFVVLSEADFRSANPKATQAIDIEDFVPLADIDPLLFEKPYYVVPQADGEKGYFLLRDALERTKKVAVAKVVLRTKQHLVAILPRGKYLVAELLRFSHEVLEEHEAKYLEDVEDPGYSDRELKMAEELIRDMSSEWDPDRYKDTYYDELMERIRYRAEHGQVNEVAAKEPAPEEPASAPVVDLLPLLRRSLENGRKPGKKSA